MHGGNLQHGRNALLQVFCVGLWQVEKLQPTKLAVFALVEAANPFAAENQAAANPFEGAYQNPFESATVNPFAQ